VDGGKIARQCDTLECLGAENAGQSDTMTTQGAEQSLSPPSYARIGDVLAGKYRIERVLGRGGMGIVVAANHVKLRQTVAIKFLLPSSTERPELSQRLLREARAAAALKGKHVARVFDVDAIDGAPYIVMEYLEGQTLAALLAAKGPLTPELTVDYALEACEALAEAHALGIVHRDLKPSNLFLARGPGGRETLRVLDFGISKAFDAERADSGLGVPPQAVDDGSTTFSGTDSHALVGSPPYVSPEQLLRPREADARSDIWSLGVVLYQCVSGRLPFQGETLTRLWDSILRGPTPEVGAEADIPAELERIVRRCLEKEPARRYSGVHELARELVPLGSGRASASLEVIEGLAGAEAADPQAARGLPKKARTAIESDETFTEAPTTREPTPLGSGALENPTWSRSRAAAVAAVVGALAGGAFLAARSHPRGESRARSTAISPAPVPKVEIAPRKDATLAPSARIPTTSSAVEGTPASLPTPAGSLVRRPASARGRPMTETASVSPVSSVATSARPETVQTDVLTRAEELLGKGQISEACAVGEVAAASAPDSPSVLEFLGRCYMRLGSAEKARSYYRRYLELYPSAPNAAFVRAMLEPAAR
jgi:serine/threonine-protein kinase